MLDSINLIHALQPRANAVEAKLLLAKSLPMADEARRSLEAFLTASLTGLRIKSPPTTE